MSALDSATRQLVRLAAAVAGADEALLRAVMEDAAPLVDAGEVDEVILQSYLFAGFPRALNAARMWRSVSGVRAPITDQLAAGPDMEEWTERGEKTCSIVYGNSYELLRQNIRELHPALDAWMITDGYGKVLSRPGLDLKRRELCIVAACAATGQQRQLHSHLHGALNAGAAEQEVRATIGALDFLLPREAQARYALLLTRVVSQRAAGRPDGGSSDVR